MNWEELKEEALESLIDFLELRGDSEAEEWSAAALINIIFRFRDDLVEKCTVMCLKSGYSETDAEEITNRVFERVRQYPTFTRSECKVKDIDKCFRIYLYKIARNEFVDYITPDETPYTGEEKVIISLVDPEKDYPPEQLKLLQEKEKILDKIFSQLTTKHKTIYLTYLFHEREGRYLPKKLRDELADVVNLAKGSIRAYKKEANDLVKSMGYGK